jgi:hypothetical protein
MRAQPPLQQFASASSPSVAATRTPHCPSAMFGFHRAVKKQRHVRISEAGAGRQADGQAALVERTNARVEIRRFIESALQIERGPHRD